MHAAILAIWAVCVFWRDSVETADREWLVRKAMSLGVLDSGIPLQPLILAAARRLLDNGFLRDAVSRAQRFIESCRPLVG